MRTTGFLLIAVGFLAGAMSTLLDETLVYWPYFFGALVVGFAGVAMARLAKRREATAEGKLSATLLQAGASLERIIDNLSRLNDEKRSIDPYDVRQRIDDEMHDDVNTFVESRESITHLFGLQAYADIMTHFAAGERYLNRVWSASADGYVDEVRACLETSLSQFREARVLFEAARSRTAASAA